MSAPISGRGPRRFSIAVFPGDGIGAEITAPCVALLHRACARVGGVALDTRDWPAGARAWQEHGEALPAASMEAARASDAILLAAMGDPAIRHPDGTEITPQLDLRFALDLYAGLRPIRSIPGVPGPLADARAADIDFVLVRESVEGLFASAGRGTIEDDAEARETLVITRAGSERLFAAAFALAERRARRHQGGGRDGTRTARVTCIDKANVFRSFAFFRKIFDETAARFPHIASDRAYVDIMALNFVTNPWDHDVMVTENMFGDILSDLGAALIGGMGYAPSADIGDEHAVFQPCHGSAPDIAGQGLANPTAMFLSGAMMLDWLGERHAVPAACRAGALIERAVDAAFAGGELCTTERGGRDGLDAVCRAVADALDEVPLEVPLDDRPLVE